MTHYPYLITLALIAGTLHPIHPQLTLLIGITLMGWTGYEWYKSTPKSHYSAPLLILLLCLSIGCISTIRTISHLPKKMQSEQSKINRLIGQVISDPEESTNSFTTQIHTTTPSNLKVILQWPKHLPLPQYGNTVDIEGHFLALQQARNPGQFNYQEFLRKKGISGKFRVKKVTQIHPTQGLFLKRWAIDIRKKIHTIHKKTLAQPYADLYIGLIFGDEGLSLPKDLKTLFKKTGLTHLIVVSGSQVSLLMGVLLAGLGLLRAGPWSTYAIISAFNLLFFFVTGGEASIFRAILMAQIALLIKLLGRNTPTPYIICLTTIIMIVINPLVVFDIGAHLSFAATISLLWIAPKLKAILPGPTFIKEAAAITLSPFLLTMPILWHISNSVSFISLLTNFLMVSWIECLVVIGFASTCLGIVLPALTILLNNLAWVILKFMLWILPYFESMTILTIHIKKTHILIPIAFIGLIITTISKFESKSPQAKRWLIVTISSIAIFVTLNKVIPNEMKVTFLDVDQGDSTLIECPNGKTILIDTGQRHAESVLMPVLRYKGIQKIDLIIITHFDSDHYGSLPQLMKEIPISTIIDNGNFEKKWPDYLSTLKKYGITRIESPAGSTIQFDPVAISILYPPPTRNRSELSENNQSIVCKVTIYGHTLLFTGDLEFQKETDLVTQYGSYLDVDILKLGHHGSKTSSTPEILNATTPQIAIVSAGVNNRYRHPSKIVVDRIRDHNIPLLQTPLSGAIEGVFTKDKIRWKRMLD